MSKASIRITWVLAITILIASILLVDAFGATAILNHYLTGNHQEYLYFSFKSCNKAGGVSKPTALSETWESGGLVVTGVAFPNCSATWLFGSYKLDGNKLLLQYSPVAPRNMAMACDCPTAVRYRITGLKQAEYEVSLAEADYIEYTSLLQRLFAN